MSSSFAQNPPMAFLLIYNKSQRSVTQKAFTALLLPVQIYPLPRFPHSLCSSHTGFLAVPGTRPADLHLKDSAWLFIPSCPVNDTACSHTASILNSEVIFLQAFSLVNLLQVSTALPCKYSLSSLLYFFFLTLLLSNTFIYLLIYLYIIYYLSQPIL